jgi:hypothetical protein
MLMTRESPVKRRVIVIKSSEWNFSDQLSVAILLLTKQQTRDPNACESLMWKLLFLGLKVALLYLFRQGSWIAMMS